MTIVATLSGALPKSVKLVLEQLMESVEAFWRDNSLPTKHGVGVTQRVLRLQSRVEVLLERFRAGKVMWRRRRPSMVGDSAVPEVVVPLDPAEAAAAADVAAQAEARATWGKPVRKPVCGLPAYYGWLCEQMPNVAITLGSDLERAFSSDEMRALMRATPEVARMAGPVFRMLGLNDALLLVPDGYTGRAVAKNGRYLRVVPQQEPVRYPPEIYQAPLIVPPDYDEDRDGRKPSPMRDLGWNYRAFVNYRSYLYYYMGRKPGYI